MYYDYIILPALPLMAVCQGYILFCASSHGQSWEKEITKMLSDLQSFKMMSLIHVLLTKYNTQFIAMQYNISLSNQNLGRLKYKGC